KPEMRNTKDFEAKYNKVKAKLALSSSIAPALSLFSSKNKGLIVELYDWDKEDVSSDDEETKVKALMTLTNKEIIFVGKESARNGEWTKITIKRNTNHVTDFKLASLFGKLKYEENLIDSIYETKKSKSLISATSLLTAFFSTSIVQDFQDSPDDEEDIRSSHEYLKDLEEEYQAKSLLAKSKRFFKKGTQRFSSAKATDQTECHKCRKKGRFARDYRSNKVNQCTNEQIPTQKKKILGIGQLTEDTSSFGSKDLVFIKSSTDNSNMSITSSNIHKSSEDSTIPNHNIDEKLVIRERFTGKNAVNTVSQTSQRKRDDLETHGKNFLENLNRFSRKPKSTYLFKTNLSTDYTSLTSETGHQRTFYWKERCKHRFAPWETLSAFEEVLGALKTTGLAVVADS
nr:hypothetical protein [Tanacetum cinerariifolium]